MYATVLLSGQILVSIIVGKPYCSLSGEHDVGFPLSSKLLGKHEDREPTPGLD